MSLRDCLRLQRIPRWGVIDFTLFGRALLQTRNEDLPEAMLYWIRLPIFQHKYQIQYDEERMSQATLCFHGHDGFRVLWIPLQIEVKHAETCELELLKGDPMAHFKPAPLDNSPDGKLPSTSV